MIQDNSMPAGGIEQKVGSGSADYIKQIRSEEFKMDAETIGYDFPIQFYSEFNGWKVHVSATDDTESSLSKGIVDVHILDQHSETYRSFQYQSSFRSLKAIRDDVKERFKRPHNLIDIMYGHAFNTRD
ncbi:MAG: hypothetical protein ACMXYK_02445 [Candidatus Woesearchaeota archaeon]